MPVRAQPAGIERSVAVYRTLAAICENHLGVYCSVATPGRVAVGDPVEISA
jgi:MOSC domain-containing protein YiiM